MVLLLADLASKKTYSDGRVYRKPGFSLHVLASLSVGPSHISVQNVEYVFKHRGIDRSVRPLSSKNCRLNLVLRLRAGRVV